MDNNRKADIKQYFHNFRVPLIITGVLLIIWLIGTFVIPHEEAVTYVSGNTERVYGSQRVFDYGDQLTNDEESKLEAKISEAESLTALDIVIVTLNESLENYEPEYRSRYTMEITPEKYVMVYADKFWEDGKFGFDKPQVLNGKTDSGDGVILVDNVFREADGNIYTWMGTSGKAQDRYSEYDIDYCLDVFYEEVEYDYYQACADFVDEIVKDNTSSHNDFDGLLESFFGLAAIVALAVTLVYFLTHKSSKAAVNTVKNETYLEGMPDFTIREDRFIRKSVTKTRIETSSSSGGSHGGGGGHISGGGGSHGGGGHSR